jgi:membrane protease subunit (stomatin/prohibitin family)
MGIETTILARNATRRGVVDRIKYDGPTNVLCWKYPYEDITLGAQLIVNQSQYALLVREGRHLALMGPGRHTLTTANLPVLNTFVNLPFAGSTPFTAKVWYFNTAVDLDVKFGTATPILVTEPRFNVIVPVQAHGQLGLRLADCRKFLKELVGTMDRCDTEQVYAFFRGMIITKLKVVVGEAIINDKVSILDITASLDVISQRCREAVSPEFERFGLSVVNLYVTDIAIPEGDPILRRLRSIMMDRSEFDVLGDNRYVAKRSFDVLDQAAQNPGDVGQLMGAGLGLGIGAGIGMQAANLGGLVNPHAGQGAKPLDQLDISNRLGRLKGLLDQELITQADFDAKKQSILKDI